MLTVLVEANNTNSVNSFFAFATSRSVNAMRGAAAQNQSPNRDQQGMLQSSSETSGARGSSSASSDSASDEN
jgi:hypothetical protein